MLFRSASERRQFGLTGRLPYTVNTLDQQCARASDQLTSHENDLQKNAFLQSLKEQNIVLYYAMLTRNLKELMPIIYTPTEVISPAAYVPYRLNELLGGCDRSIFAYFSTE